MFMQIINVMQTRDPRDKYHNTTADGSFTVYHKINISSKKILEDGPVLCNSHLKNSLMQLAVPEIEKGDWEQQLPSRKKILRMTCEPRKPRNFSYSKYLRCTICTQR